MTTLADLRSWVIAYAGSVGQGYVGRHKECRVDGTDDTTTILEPWVITSGYLMTPQKQIARPYVVFPLEMMVMPIPSLTIRHHARIFLADLDEGDFAEIAGHLLAAVHEAERMRVAIKSQRSGLVLAPADTKLPPTRRG